MKKRSIRDELGFTNVKWKKVLKEIVDFAPTRFGVGKNYQIGEDHELVELLKIKPHELMLSLLFLKDQGLIEFDQSEHHFINLTSKGFDVALQNENQKLAFRTNYVIVLFTAIFTFMTVVDVIEKGVSWITGILIVAFLGMIMFYAWRTWRIK